MSDQTYRIVELTAENFKRLKAVRVAPQPAGVVPVCGRNAQGKSSLLDAIEAALGGKDHCPPNPVRAGAESARIVADLGTIRVVRSFTATGSTLRVEAGPGLQYRTPQAVLDELVGRLTFDPLAFARMPPAAQADTLRRLLGIDTATLDADRARAYAERTEVGRALRQAEAALAAQPHYPDAGDDERELDALLDAQDAAFAKARARADLANEADAAAKSAAFWREREAMYREQMNEAAGKAERQEREARAKRDVLATTPDPAGELATLKRAIADADEHNRRVQANVAHRQLEADAAAWRARYDALTGAIEAADARKARLLDEAAMPIEGLSLFGDEVQYRGQPLAQASQAERVRVGLALGAALDPPLRVVLVRDGSLLDAAAMAELAAWAEASDLQVFVERVSEPGAGVGVIIEDGEASGPLARPAADPPPRKGRRKAEGE